MKKLTLEILITAAEDAEYSRYQVLAALKEYLHFLHKNKLYPPLADLIETKKLINQIFESKTKLNDEFPKTLLRFDLNKKKSVYEESEYSEKELEQMFNFITWMLPQINEAIHEGKSIFDFVDENLTFEEVGIIPLYKNDGYLLVPDNKKKIVNLYRFETSLLKVSNEQMRSLKTNFIHSYDNNEFNKKFNNDFKLELIKSFSDLPNPLIYKVETDLDFPFDETILPVAKRKLIQQLAA